MLRWFRKDGAEGENHAPGGQDASAVDEWAFLRDQPDHDADEMSSVHSNGSSPGYDHFTAAPSGEADSPDEHFTWDEAPGSSLTLPSLPRLPDFDQIPVIRGIEDVSSAFEARADHFTAPDAELDGPELLIEVQCGAASKLERVGSRTLIGFTDPSREVYAEIDLNQDPLVSPRQAMIIRRGSSFIVKDVGSEHGTRLNGELLELGAEAPLMPGDVVSVGEMSHLRVVDAPGGDGLTEEDETLAAMALQAAGFGPVGAVFAPQSPPGDRPERPSAAQVAGQPDLLDALLAAGEAEGLIAGLPAETDGRGYDEAEPPTFAAPLARGERFLELEMGRR